MTRCSTSDVTYTTNSAEGKGGDGGEGNAYGKQGDGRTDGRGRRSITATLFDEVFLDFKYFLMDFYLKKPYMMALRLVKRFLMEIILDYAFFYEVLVVFDE